MPFSNSREVNQMVDGNMRKTYIIRQWICGRSLSHRHKPLIRVTCWVRDMKMQTMWMAATAVMLMAMTAAVCDDDDDDTMPSTGRDTIYLLNVRAAERERDANKWSDWLNINQYYDCWHDVVCVRMMTGHNKPFSLSHVHIFLLVYLTWFNVCRIFGWLLASCYCSRMIWFVNWNPTIIRSSFQCCAVMLLLIQ